MSANISGGGVKALGNASAKNASFFLRAPLLFLWFAILKKFVPQKYFFTPLPL